MTIPNQGVANGYTLAYRLMFNINGGKRDWPNLAAALSRAEQRDPSSFLLRPPSPTSFDFLTVNVVVECIDRNYPRSRERLRRELATSDEASPLLGPSIGYGPPTYDHNHAPACVLWPGARTSRHHGNFRASRLSPHPGDRHHRRPRHPLPGFGRPHEDPGQRAAAHLPRRGACRLQPKPMRRDRGDRLPQQNRSAAAGRVVRRRAPTSANSGSSNTDNPADDRPRHRRRPRTTGPTVNQVPQ